MIEPLQSDQALLDDVTRAVREVDDDTVRLWWLGQSGYLLQWRKKVIAIDPYLSDSLTVKYAATPKPHVRMSRRVVDPARLNFVRIILSSHNHTDHLDAETLRPMLRDNPARVIAPAANLEMVSQRTGLAIGDIVGVNDGQAIDIDDFHITPVPAAHDQLERDEQGRCRYLGYVIKAGGFTLYHSGDTVRYEGMADRLRPFNVDVAILPINGKVGNMEGATAARLAKAIGARIVIPCHYDMFEFNTADPAEQFIPECERLGQAYRVLRLGERFSSTEIPR